MARILYLVHRLPYPPNKGDKVRSYHLLKHLVRRHQVFLGSFVDEPDDAKYVNDLREMCAGVHVEHLDPRGARVRSLTGLLAGEALTLPFYRSRALAAWVERTIREQRPDAAIVFSSPMAQYVPQDAGMTLLVDLVDVDSAKWTQYAGDHRWPLSWVYAREGRMLLKFERAAVWRSTRAFLVTDAEVELFRHLAPECADKIEAVCNGVDAGYFSPEHRTDSPFAPGESPIVFTGAMDYWPNIDAVTWFVLDIVPALVSAIPSLRFYIVGMRPAPAVRALAGDHVVVTGMVPDVRPYLAYARAVVAPLRIARGVQNKVLEAMAMARPVVVSEGCAGGIEGTPGAHLETAADAPGFVARLLSLLRDPVRAEAMGRAARGRVQERYSWDARLARVDRWLTPAGSDAFAQDPRVASASFSE